MINALALNLIADDMRWDMEEAAKEYAGSAAAGVGIKAWEV